MPFGGGRFIPIAELVKQGYFLELTLMSLWVRHCKVQEWDNAEDCYLCFMRGCLQSVN